MEDLVSDTADWFTIGDEVGSSVGSTVGVITAATTATDRA
jgi:hypothetical protein